MKSGKESIMEAPINLIIRDACELDPDDPEKEDTISINIDTLRVILRAHLAEKNEGLMALAKLGLWVLNTRDDGDCADLDGQDIQLKAIKLGLIAEVDAMEPCGDGCRCLAELGLPEFPTPCLRLTDKAKVLDK